MQGGDVHLKNKNKKKEPRIDKRTREKSKKLERELIKAVKTANEFAEQLKKSRAVSEEKLYRRVTI